MIMILYHLAIIIWGVTIFKKYFFEKQEMLFSFVASIVLGIAFSIPITYLLAVLFKDVDDPIRLSTILFTTVTFIFLWMRRKKISLSYPTFLTKKEILDIGVVLFCVLFSSYIMNKTFKMVGEHTISVERNTVFDFGHNLSILRSMSWGQNIPYTSPFVANTEHLYHFMFQVWSAILEHSGVPITIAVNFPSIIAFTLFLLVIYTIGKNIFKNTVVGMLGVILILFHSGLMFIPFIQQRGFSPLAVFRNPNYLFFGPFDGSTYSLFFTLNVFVNQRHLAFGLALFFVLYLLFREDVVKKKLTLQKVMIYAVFIGLFTLWHLVLTVGLLFVFLLILALQKKWKESFVLISNSLFIALIFIHPWLPPLTRAAVSFFVQKNPQQSVVSVQHESVLIWFLKFIFLNFGMILAFISVGILREKKARIFFAPLFALIGIFTIISTRVGAVDQKYLNVLLVLSALFAASGLIAIWNKRTIGKIIVILLFPVLIYSGIIDFMVIKNDYMFPLEQTANGKLVSWIQENTSKNAIFVSYQDIFDPVTLAGRKNYYGFYKESTKFLIEADQHRDEIVAGIFEASDEAHLREEAEKTKADYIVIPLWDKPDFFYHVNIPLMKRTFPTVYENKEHVILSIQ